MMDNLGERALVVKALTSGLSNCVVWKDAKTRQQIRDDPQLHGLTANAIKGLVVEFVKNGGVVEQIPECRDGYKDEHRFYYKAIVPFSGFPRGIFVEMVLLTPDHECPVVSLVSAHPQRT